MNKLPESAAGARPSRRLLLGAAVGSALAAVGWGWWHYQVPPAPDADRRLADAAPELQAFWTTAWADPAGKPLAVQAFQGKPLLINFWATWCPPCVEELPLLNAFFLQNKANGWQVLGLAVDRAEAVQRFLRQNPLDFPVAMAGLGGADLARALGNMAGGLPFSVAVNGTGAIAKRKLGRVTPENLQQWAGLK